MPADILNHQPAGPSTILPGTWLIDLPPGSAIHVRRYRSQVSTESVGNGNGAGNSSESDSEVRDDTLEKAWRGINTSTSPGVSVRNILKEPCAVICSIGDLEDASVKDVEGRELWCFQVKDGDDAEDAFGGILNGSDELEMVENHFAVEPAHLLNCPRHGHDLSCLLRPSTSQRPLKSCDVRFEPHGEDKVVWEKLAQAIVEKVQWNRGKRIFVKREKRLRIDLYPTPTGLQLRTRSLSSEDDRYRPPRTTDRHSDSILEPLGLSAILLGPHSTTQSEGETLGASFERVLGPGWKDGQMACRTQAQLGHRSYHPYSVLWVPTPGPASTAEPPSPGSTSASAMKDDQGVLTIWPTHLITEPRKKRDPNTKSSLPTPVNPSDDHLGLMTAASSLFDIASAYKEPEPDNTPPSDRSIEEAAVIPDPHEAQTPTSQPSPAKPPDSDAEDDLENLFASDTPPRTPELFDSEKAFEMFGEQSSRRISNGDSAHLIDYGDVIMSFPPAEEERRPSVRQVMGGSDVTEEAEAVFVTEDDFNFFDSPPDEAVPETAAAPAETIKEPDDQQPVSVEAAENVNNTQASSPAEPTPVEIIPPRDLGTEVINETDRLDPRLDSTSPKQVQAPADQAEPKKDVPPSPHSLPTPATSTSIPEPRVANHRSLVPIAFEPLELSNPGTTFAYSLPSPAPTPQNLNADLIERLSSPKTTKKTYEYAAAWLLDSPPSEADDEEYTGPPTPISEIEDYDESTATPMPVVPAKAGSGVLEYEGMSCVATEWFGMIDDLARTHALSRPWVKTWTIRNLGAGPASAEINTSKKRKRTSDIDKPGGELDLTALARQVICNRDLRRQLTKSNISLHHDAEPQVAADLGTTGTSLADFAPPSIDEDSLEAVDEEPNGSGTFKQCDIHLGFRGNVMRMSIASLRYWRELDLQPLGGDKDVKAIALVESLNDMDAAKQVCARLGDTYKTLGLGAYELDTSFGDGGLQSTSGKKQPLLQAIQWISKQEGNAAVLLICSSITPASLQVYFDPTSISGLSATQIVHFVPLSTLVQRDVHDVARSIYDRFPRQLHRVDHVNQGEAPWYQYPTFTLSPDDPPKPNLTLSWPIKSFDVFGSWRWIHTAYAWSQDRQSLIVVISDAEGENWGVKVVSLGQDPKPQARVKAVWEIASAFANTTAIEYRISVCHMGIMSPKEIEAWRQLFVMTPTPVSVMMSEPAAIHSSGPSPPRNGPPNVVPGLLNDPSSTIIDDSLAGSYYTLPQRQPVILKDSTCYYPDSTFLLSLATSAPAMEYETSTLHILCHKPIPGKEEEEVAESVLAREMYRMSCWSRLKFGLEGLPGHLAAVRAVQDAFALDEE